MYKMHLKIKNQIPDHSDNLIKSEQIETKSILMNEENLRIS